MRAFTFTLCFFTAVSLSACSVETNTDQMWTSMEGADPRGKKLASIAREHAKKEPSYEGAEKKKEYVLILKRDGSTSGSYAVSYRIRNNSSKEEVQSWVKENWYVEEEDCLITERGFDCMIYDEVYADDAPVEISTNIIYKSYYESYGDLFMDVTASEY